MLGDSFLFQIVIGFGLLTLSVLTFGKKRSVSLFLLFTAALVLGFAVALLDPFLFIWDEQYHALVAKNLSKDMLKPMLFSNPILPFDSSNWTANHVWVHKQPLFLWQIALSIKCFGTTTLAVRLPSILMHALLPLIVYRIGKLSLNERIGFIAALLFAVGHYPLELMAGRYSTDHNDFAFLFYVTASFWAFLEYQNGKKWYWLVAAGVCSGGAVLTKWLLGLLIYPSWFFAHVLASKNRFDWNSYLPMAAMFAISCAVFLPWQLYIFSVFPEEAKYEFSMISKHLSEVVEGHSEARFYYFNEGLNNIYGSGYLVRISLLLGLILLLVRLKSLFFRILFAASVFIVYTIYTYAETKMPSFPVVVYAFGVLALATLFYSFYTILRCWISKSIIRKTLAIPILLYALFLFLDIGRIELNHGFRDESIVQFRQNELAELDAIRQIEMKLNQPHIIFNASFSAGGNIPIMFFTDHTAYPQIPTIDELELCKKHSELPLAIFDREDLPVYIHSDSTIVKLRLSFPFNH